MMKNVANRKKSSGLKFEAMLGTIKEAIPAGIHYTNLIFTISLCITNRTTSQVDEVQCLMTLMSNTTRTMTTSFERCRKNDMKTNL